MVTNFKTMIKVNFAKNLKKFMIKSLSTLSFDDSEEINPKIRWALCRKMGDMFNELLDPEGTICLDSFKQVTVTFQSNATTVTFQDQNNTCFGIVEKLFRDFQIGAKNSKTPLYLSTKYFERSWSLILSNYIQMNKAGQFSKNFQIFPEPSLMNKYFLFDKDALEAINNALAKESKQKPPNSKKRKRSTVEINETKEKTMEKESNPVEIVLPKDEKSALKRLNQHIATHLFYLTQLEPQKLRKIRQLLPSTQTPLLNCHDETFTKFISKNYLMIKSISTNGDGISLNLLRCKPVSKETPLTPEQMIQKKQKDKVVL